MDDKEIKKTLIIAGAVIVGLIAFFIFVVPNIPDENEQERLELEMNKCEYSAAGDIYGPNGKCVIDYGPDGKRHVYWERER